MASTISPNMGLTIPTVGTQPGPQYASNINASLTLVDAHDHSLGNGVQITPSGLNINDDLMMNSNDLLTIRTLALDSQPSAISGTELRRIYSVSGDLYYNDGVGNQIPITANGAVAGSPGSIANLVAPASASYVSGSTTFVWQSAANTAANMDAGSYKMRNLTVNSFALTLSPPSLSSNYTITLPALPASQKIMTLDNSGNMTAPYVVDNSTIEVATNTIQVKASGITTTQLADNAVTTSKITDLNVTTGKIANLNVTNDKLADGSVGTSKIIDGNVTTGKLLNSAVTFDKIADANVIQAKLAPRGSSGSTAGVGEIAVSSASGSFTTTSTSPVNITNLSVTITTVGRPVYVGLIAQSSTSQLYTAWNTTGIGIPSASVSIVNGGSNVLSTQILGGVPQQSGTFQYNPVGGIWHLDVRSAGTYTYTVTVATVASTTTFGCVNVRLIAYEI